MSKDDYNVYKGTDGKWRGKRQDASRASVVGDTQEEVFQATRNLAKKAKTDG